MSETILEKLYRFVLFIQISFLFIFLVQNYDNLNSIKFQIKLSSDLDFVFILNLWVVVPAMIVIYSAILILSINIAASGVSDEGLRKVANFIRILILYIFLNLGMAYYFGMLAQFGLVVLMFVSVIYFIHSVNSLQE